MAAWPAVVASLAAAVESGEMDAELRACSAAHLCAIGVVGAEGAKLPVDTRAALDRRLEEHGG